MSFLSEADTARLEAEAQRIRASVITMLAESGSGHLAGSLGMADVFTSFYFHILKHDPRNPDWEERDRLILSNGHIAPVRYASMAHAGYFPVEELLTLRKMGSRLQGHPERTRLPGVETTSGPLGDGLTQACGMALGLRMDESESRVYALLSDGEHQAGITWEAIMFAGNKKLANLTVVVDRNNIQISGPTEDVMPLEPLVQKYEAFNWNVIEVDGNNIEMFVDAVAAAREETKKPTVIIAHTIPGKGVPEIEGDYKWHGKVPTKEQAEKWIAALEHE
jgi:transketolase